jgi:endonuclease/exonuclease/phosphatase family metal-dependent hydrolase
MKILTCNIRCFGAEDGENNWEHRKDLCADVIRAQSPDVICFQEMWAEQYADVSRALGEFRSYGMADTASGRHPQNCIFYRADLYTVVSAGGYWLSQTPHVPGSKSWESCCVRLANWVRLQERASGREVRVVNTHLDHVGQSAREHQARLVSEDTSAYPADYPQLLTGDMNCDCTNRAIQAFKEVGWSDTYGLVHGTENPGHTYHAFVGEEHQPEIGKMDWIFVKGAMKAVAAEVIKDSRDGRFPSDHYFVSATLEWTPPGS